MSITNQFFWQFEIFDFFVRIGKFELGPILEVNIWKIEFLEASSPNFPWSSLESGPGSATIISWTFGIRKKYFIWNIKKVLKLRGIWRFFKVWVLITPEWACSNVFACGNMKHTWNLCEKPFSRHISRALVHYGGAENGIKWKIRVFWVFLDFWEGITFSNYNIKTKILILVKKR